MSFNIVDRRNNSKGKSSDNRQRFLKRISDQIKKAMPDIIRNNNIKDLTSGSKKVNIPVKGVDEPQFVYDPKSGNKKRVLPGNKEYVEGDQIEKPNGGRGRGGSKGSNSPEITEDDFTVTISREEFLDFFFEDLELPDLVKKELTTIIDQKNKRAGFTQYGTPSRLNVLKTYKNSIGRRIAMNLSFDKQIKNKTKELETANEEQKEKLLHEIDKLKKLKSTIGLIEEVDLRYNNFEPKIIHVTSAVMMCIMDVSGSMDEIKKSLSKRFFMLLYMFLIRQYEKIELVFIRHHTEAKEVTEEEFFNSRESGGTMVIPALELANKLIDERYLNTNVYITQASDGDTQSDSDAYESYEFVNNVLLNKIQYMIYIEVDTNDVSDLWSRYNKISNPKFNMGKIKNIGEIQPTFQKFFKKKSSKI